MKFKFTHPELIENDVVGPKYWKSLDEVADTPEFRQWLEGEFPAGVSELEGVDRRHFLKIMAASFGFAGLGLSGCRQPEQNLLPYSRHPERIIPGVPIYYATSRPGARGSIPVIVETHDARPTKIEGNPSDELYGGATDAFTQASILDLYDPDRSQKSYGENMVTMSKVEVGDKLKAVYEMYRETAGEGLAFLAEPSSSPSRERLVKTLKQKLPKATWAEYEPVDNDNPLRALEKQFGKPLRPWYHFDKAKRVLSLDADFLHGECGHLACVGGFSKSRRVSSTRDADKMNRLYVVESDYSITGSMGDHRLRLSTSYLPAFTCLVAAEIFELTGGNNVLVATLRKKAVGLDVDMKWVCECAKDLVEYRGSAVVAAGSHLSEVVHLLVVAMNTQLKAHGNTVSYIEVPRTEAASIRDLAKQIESGGIKTLMILRGNPVYNAPADLNWPNLQKKINQVIRHGYHYDETSKLSQMHVADVHYLESWGDGRTWEGSYVPVQPMIMPLFDGISELELVSRVSGDDKTEPYEIVRKTFSEINPKGSFDEWLSVGVYKETVHAKVDMSFDIFRLASVINRVNMPTTGLSEKNLEIRFKPSAHTGDGRFANNGWMQELPDPMTRISWDNAILISPRLARELSENSGIPLLPDPSMMSKLGQANINDNNFKIGKEHAFIAELTVNGKTVKGPLHIKPGMADYTLVLELGYGRDFDGRVGSGIGYNAYPLLATTDMASVMGASLKVRKEQYQLVNVQEHWSMEGRAIIREASVGYYKKHPDFAGKMGIESHAPANLGAEKNDPLQEVVKSIPRGGSMYKTPDFKGEHQWAMTIDLNTCTGCNACVVACQSENNIAIVGKDQMLRGREMHWIRIDRYFSSCTDNKQSIPEDPQVSFMSVTCQHCELAPCEMVCPVNATVHDDEGLNVMAYNRCVGTRYCANNCPYKVRRFNFFDWNKRKEGHYYEGPLGPAGVEQLHRMQKNPDVSLRMRGVMEKCTYCVQRIEEAKINQRNKAKDSGNVQVPDGTIKTACQQVCASGSIIFGDVADKNSEVSKMKAQDRDYSLLGYLNTRPRTTYLAKLRNPNPLMPNYYAQPLSRVENERRYGHSSHDELEGG